jgi:uncharacterized protein (TIGR03086 family)
MNDSRAAEALTGEVALLERAIGYALGNLRAVTSDLLARPTPCSRWDLRALLEHMDDSLAALQEAADLGHVALGSARLAGGAGGGAGRGAGSAAGGADEAADPAAPGADPAADLVGALRARACRMLGGWVLAGTRAAGGPGGTGAPWDPATAGSPAGIAGGAGPAWASAGYDVVSVGGLPAPAELVAGAGAVEIAVHGWDVCRACGLDRPIPDELAAEMLGLVPFIVADADRPGRFAQPVPVAADASPGDRLVAFLGRRPH